MPLRAPRRTLSASIALTSLMLAVGLSGCGKTETSASLMADAKQYQQKGDNKAALIQLKNAAAKNPEDGEVRLQLAKLYQDLADPVSAEKEIRKAMSLGIDAVRTAPVLAATLMAQGQAQKALDETAAAGAKAPAEVTVLRGEAFLATSQPDKAKESFESVLAAKPGDAAALLGMARYALIQRDADGAKRYIDDAIARNPKSTDVLMFNAALQRAQGKPELALETYTKVLALQPANNSAHLEKAMLEIGIKKYDAATADIDAARKLAPNSLMVTYAQAMLDNAQQKYAAARDNLLKVLRAAPDHMPSLLLAGAVEYSLGSLPQSEQYLKKYLEKNPGNLYARKLMANTLLKAGRQADALAVLAPALSAGQQDPQLLALAGQAYLQSRDFDKATDYLEKASALAPQEAKLHTSLALSKLGLGDDAGAISELQLSTKLDGKVSQSGMLLAMTELRLKHYDKALAAVAALETAQPSDPAVQNLKGGIELQMNNKPAARASFEKALALQPTFFPAVMNLAQMSMQENQPDAAKKRFETVLEKDKKNVDAMTALAALAVAQGHPEQATTWLERASTENADAIVPALRLVAHYLKTGDKQKALTLARKVAVANPANTDALEILAQAQLVNGDQAGALDSYSKLAAALPKSPVAHARLGSLHIAMHNDAAAAEDLKRALALQPDFVPALLGQVDLALRARQPEQAMAIARRLQQQRANAPIGYGLEGDLQLAQKKPELALPAFEKAYALTPTAALMVKLHTAMTQSGKQAQADVRMAQWQKAHPADMVSNAYLSESALAKKDYKKAIPLLQLIVKQNPKNVAALNNLAWAYQQEKDPRALATAEQAYPLANQNPGVIDTLGWLLVEQGNMARGLPLLRKAAELAPQAIEIRYHLASALSRSGDKSGARKELAPVLAAGAAFPDIEAARALNKQL